MTNIQAKAINKLEQDINGLVAQLDALDSFQKAIAEARAAYEATKN